jgi:hypothetical protein
MGEESLEDLRADAEEAVLHEEGLRRRVMERLAEYNATDAILTLFEKHPRIVVQGGKYYRLVLQMHPKTPVSLVKDGSPPRVMYRGKRYWSFRLGDSYWLGVGQRGRPPALRDLEEFDEMLEAAASSKNPYRKTRLDQKTFERLESWEADPDAVKALKAYIKEAERNNELKREPTQSGMDLDADETGN